MANISLYLFNRKKQDGTQKVYLSVVIDSDRWRIPSPVDIEAFFWDKKMNQVRIIHPLHEEYNLILNNMISRANQISRTMYILEKQETISAFKKEWMNYQTSTENFVTYAEKYLESKKQIFKESTLKSKGTAIKKIAEFNKETTIADINYEYLTDFENWLTKKEFGINYRHKIFKDLKSFLTHYYKTKNSSSLNPFKDFKLKKGKSRVIYLDLEELEKLKEFYKSKLIQDKQEWKLALRAWLFSATCGGLRKGDLFKIGQKNVVNGRIDLSVTKLETINKQYVVFKITVYGQKLIDDAIREGYKKRFFNAVNEDTVNRSMKEIASLLKIKKEVSLHVARHTFATLFYRSTKDLISLQKILGHGSISSTMIYAHIHQDDIDNCMVEFEKATR